jgi:N,N'-diacetyllegionaminate synthase
VSNRTNFNIGGVAVGPSAPGFIVAEVAQAHDGSLRMAHSFIDAIATAGADCVKFQLHLPDFESTTDEKFRVEMGSQDADRFSYWRRTGFKPTEWAELALHAKERELVFLCSAFSVQGAKLLREMEIDAWKIASGEVGSIELIDYMLEDSKPIIASTGMASITEIESLVKRLSKHGNPLVLLQCTSKYPTPIEEAGLNIMGDLEAYGCAVGLSDHSGTPFPALAALARGADVIEVHVTFDKRIQGPDSSSSISFAELEMICQARDCFEAIDRNPVDKDVVAKKLENTKVMFGKSVALKGDGTAGTVVTEEMICFKKPGTGIQRNELARIVGKTLVQDVSSRCLLKWSDFV